MLQQPSPPRLILDSTDLAELQFVNRHGVKKVVLKVHFLCKNVVYNPMQSCESQYTGNPLN